MTPITLPNFWLVGRVYVVYDDGLSDTRTPSMFAMYEEAGDLEPTFDVAEAFVKQHVPEEFRHTVQDVVFERSQPLVKIRLGQSDLCMGTQKAFTMEASFETVRVCLDVYHGRKPRRRIEKNSTRIAVPSEEYTPRVFVKGY